VVREAEDGDLEGLLGVYVSNRSYLELTEGSGGEPGHYDLDMLRRDVTLARATPGRFLACVFLKGEDEPVGVLDWMDANPSDGLPWIGLLMVRADVQRQGYATEAFNGLVAHLRERGRSKLRAGVIERNAAGLALVEQLGFERVSRTVLRLASWEEVVVVERSLS
jgi:RimJ/RimL family protein N-acetyltransferase